MVFYAENRGSHAEEKRLPLVVRFSQFLADLLIIFGGQEGRKDIQDLLEAAKILKTKHVILVDMRQDALDYWPDHKNLEKILMDADKFSFKLLFLLQAPLRTFIYDNLSGGSKTTERCLRIFEEIGHLTELRIMVFMTASRGFSFDALKVLKSDAEYWLTGYARLHLYTGIKENIALINVLKEI